jgi:hypothetical protein
MSPQFCKKMEQKLCSKVFTMLKDSEFRKLAKENSLCLLPKFHKLLSFLLSKWIFEN